MESLEAEEFQPMGMAPTGHELRRTFADTLGPVASREGAVIQKEPEQIQVTLPQVPAEKEIAPQATVEVLDQGTASGRFVHRSDNGIQYAVKLPRQLPIQPVAALPVSLRSIGFTLEQADGPDLKVRNLELLGDLGQFRIKHPGKPQQSLALPFEGDAHWANSGRIQKLPLFQFSHDEVEEFASVSKAGTCKGQDVPFQPAAQGLDILG